VERLLQLQRMATIQFCLMGIILMISVYSHYLNDPLPKNIVLSPEEKREYWEELLCGANLRRL
jgi:hypothetical protein